MKLKNSILITGLYTGTSKFPFWKNLKIDDIVELSIELESYRSHRGLYATNVSIKNITQKQIFSSSIADTARYLSKLKYSERLK